MNEKKLWGEIERATHLSCQWTILDGYDDDDEVNKSFRNTLISSFFVPARELFFLIK